jgi:hypothetical protein
MTLTDFSRDWVPIIQTVILLIGVISLPLIWWQIRETRLWNKLQSPFNYVDVEKESKLEKEAQEACLKLGIDLIKKKAPLSDEEVHNIREDKGAYYAVKFLLDYEETLCAAINVGNADEELSYAVHSAGVDRCYTLFSNYIKAIRESCDDREIYYELERTALRWRILQAEREEKQISMISKLNKKLEKLSGTPKKA